MGGDTRAIVNHSFNELIPTVAPRGREGVDLFSQSLPNNRLGVAASFGSKGREKRFDRRVDGGTRSLPSVTASFEAIF